MLDLPAGSRLLAPLVRHRKGTYEQVFEDVRKAGFVRVRVDGEILDVGDEIKLDRYKNHTIEVVVDRLVVPRTEESGLRTESGGALSPEKTRIADSVEQALRLRQGTIVVSVVDGEELTFSEHFACRSATSVWARSSRGPSPSTVRTAPVGLRGLGNRLEVDPDLVIPNKALSIAEGAIASWGKAGINGNAWYREVVEAVGRHYGFSTRVPVSELSDKHLQIVLFSSKVSGSRFATSSKRGGRSHEFRVQYEGLVPNLERRYKETESDYIRSDIERYMATRPCPTCKGARLKPGGAQRHHDRPADRRGDHFSVVNALAFFTALEEHVGRSTIRQPLGAPATLAGRA